METLLWLRCQSGAAFGAPPTVDAAQTSLATVFIQGLRRTAQISAEMLVISADNEAMSGASKTTIVRATPSSRESCHVSHWVGCRTAKTSRPAAERSFRWARYGLGSRTDAVVLRAPNAMVFAGVQPVDYCLQYLSATRWRPSDISKAPFPAR